MVASHGVKREDVGWMLTYLGPSGLSVLENPTRGHWRVAPDARNRVMSLVSTLLAQLLELPYDATR